MRACACVSLHARSLNLSVTFCLHRNRYVASNWTPNMMRNYLEGSRLETFPVPNRINGEADASNPAGNQVAQTRPAPQRHRFES